jgi:hypothetical protein
LILASSPRVPDEELKLALAFCLGNFAETGRRVGLTREAVRLRVKSSPELQAVVREGRDVALDVAESRLIKAVKAGKPWAVRFILSTWGKSRGFTTRTEVSAELEPRGKVILMLPDNGRDEGEPPP